MVARPKVVTIGGGSGLANILRGLKNYPISLSAIVTMTDNGKSSGRLIREMGILPPGDIRKCLEALSSDEQLVTKLFEYRFSKGRGLSGHSLGNLLLTALSDITGDFDAAVQASSKILSIKGEVIPSTLSHVNLVARLKNSQLVEGEVNARIQGHRYGINDIMISPADVKANPRATHFINNADVIILGPGSLYTSVIPNLLIKEIHEAVKDSKAAKLYVCNVSTERGETERYGVEDHIATLCKYLDCSVLDAILINDNIVSQSKKQGKLGNVYNITTDKKEINGIRVVSADLINDQRPLFHDPKKLGAAIWQLITS